MSTILPVLLATIVLVCTIHQHSQAQSVLEMLPLPPVGSDHGAPVGNDGSLPLGLVPGDVPLALGGAYSSDCQGPIDLGSGLGSVSTWDNPHGWGLNPPGPRWTVRWETLAWWIRGQHVPALLTTSPTGTPIADAGILGLPTSSVVFGDSRLDREGTPGGRFSLGYSLDPGCCHRIEGQYFLLDRGVDAFNWSAPGDYDILARPFSNTFTGQGDAQLVHYPGIVDGQFSTRSETDLHGWGLWYRVNLCCLSASNGATCDPCLSDFYDGTESRWQRLRGRWKIPGLWRGPMSPGYLTGGGLPLRRFDLLLGYRNLDLDEAFRVQERLVSTDPGSSIPLGTEFDLVDRVQTENEFDGSDLGLSWYWTQGRWGLAYTARTGLGRLRKSATIDGSTGINAPTGSVSSPGGILALDSNSGSYSEDEFTIVPEVGITLYYQLTSKSRIVTGYNVLVLPDVWRPADQFDLNLDPRLFPPASITDGLNPRFTGREDDLWIYGLQLGCELMF